MLYVRVMDREPVRYLDPPADPPAGDPPVDPGLQSLSTFLDDLPSGDPVADPKAPPAFDPEKYVPIEQFNALKAQNEKYASLGPIADELARNPARAEELRRQIINGPAAPAPPVAPQPAAGPVALTEEQKQKVVAAFFENPLGVIAAVAQPVAERIAAEKFGASNSTVTSHAVRLFYGAKAAEDADEYASTKPFFDEALQGVNLEQLSGPALDNFLAISWDASAAKAYRNARKGAAPPVAAPASEPPPYGGSLGAPSRAATAPIQRAAGAAPAPGGGEVRTLVAGLARSSGLTQADFKKYGAQIDDQLGA